jgi:hypothetical protein
MTSGRLESLLRSGKKLLPGLHGMYTTSSNCREPCWCADVSCCVVG